MVTWPIQGKCQTEKRIAPSPHRPPPAPGDVDAADVPALRAQLAAARENVAALTVALHDARRTIDELIENCPVVIHVKDLDGRFVHVNKHYEEVVGSPRAAVLGHTVFEVYPPAVAEMAHERDLEVIRSRKPVAEETVIDIGATSRVFLDTKFPLFDAGGAVRGTAGIAIEITEQKRMERALIDLANTDALTGLANRRHFFENFAQEFNRSRRYANPLALMYFDLDHFKEINDHHGHASGDIVLKDVARCVLQTLRNTDLAGRLGGEEFAILMPETGLAEAAEAADRLRRVIADATTYAPDGQPIRITISFGVACLRADDAPRCDARPVPARLRRPWQPDGWRVRQGHPSQLCPRPRPVRQQTARQRVVRQRAVRSAPSRARASARAGRRRRAP